MRLFAGLVLTLVLAAGSAAVDLTVVAVFAALAITGAVALCRRRA